MEKSDRYSGSKWSLKRKGRCLKEWYAWLGIVMGLSTLYSAMDVKKIANISSGKFMFGVQKQSFQNSDAMLCHCTLFIYVSTKMDLQIYMHFSIYNSHRIDH